MKTEKTLFIVAGEPSGDLHAARLMQALHKNAPFPVRFVGIGGKEMEKQGLESLVPMSAMSVVGFWEVAKRYKFFRNVLQRCIGMFDTNTIDAFLPIDYPGFNERLALQAKKRHIPVLWYIAPQLWAWGKHRAAALAKSVDTLMVVFPFEQDFFANYGIRTHFVGHPLLDDPVFSESGTQHDIPLIALLPGSRLQEIHRNLPVMAEAASIMRQTIDISVGIAQSSTLPQSEYERLLSPHGMTLQNVWKNSRELMLQATAGMVKTGTSTLEASLCGMPFSMMYTTSRLSYFIGKQLVNLSSIALPNIILKKQVVQEFIQSNATPTAIAKETVRLITDTALREQQKADFAEIRTLLGGAGASEHAATLILQHL